MYLQNPRHKRGPVKRQRVLCRFFSHELYISGPAPLASLNLLKSNVTKRGSRGTIKNCNALPFGLPSGCIGYYDDFYNFSKLVKMPRQGILCSSKVNLYVKINVR